jgi:hypothetical protein
MVDKSHLHYQESPDWASFRELVNTHFSFDTPIYARQIADCALFACLPDYLRTQRLDKVTFQKIDHIPRCIKYRPPASLRFEDLDSDTYTAPLTPISCDVHSLILIDSDHFLNLHPVRYDKVKEEISLGEIPMPIVSMCDEGVPRVIDGRHRIMALFKCGVVSIEILVPTEEIDEIQRILKQGRHDETVM